MIAPLNVLPVLDHQRSVLLVSLLILGCITISVTVHAHRELMMWGQPALTAQAIVLLVVVTLTFVRLAILTVLILN